MLASMVTLGFALSCRPAAAQAGLGDSAADPVAPRRGSELLIPLGSVLVPGLGQFVRGDAAAGAAYLGVAVSGHALSAIGDPLGRTWEGSLPRAPRDQLAEQGVQLAFTAGALSGWDAFHRAVPAMQKQGRYGFLSGRESAGDLLSAPFDARFLRRWTTWVDLAHTAAVTALILVVSDPGAEHLPFQPHDALYTTSLSMNAAVGEEALFRGWLLPLLHERTAGRFWVANGLQAGLFGAAHLPDASWFAAVIGAWGVWEGWIVRRNGWSIRESVFHHFWYDVAVVTAALLRDQPGSQRSVTLVTVRF
jgi:membrane protease YdiL (CAAX protease family)